MGASAEEMGVAGSPRRREMAVAAMGMVMAVAETASEGWAPVRWSA